MSEQTFDAIEFVPVVGGSFTVADMKGSDLILPMTSGGMGPMIATDLFVMNEGAVKIGYLKSSYISPMVMIDQLSV